MGRACRGADLPWGGPTVGRAYRGGRACPGAGPPWGERVGRACPAVALAKAGYGTKIDAVEFPTLMKLKNPAIGSMKVVIASPIFAKLFRGTKTKSPGRR